MFDFDEAMLSTNCESQQCDECVFLCYGGCDGVEELDGLVMRGWPEKPWMRAMTLTLQCPKLSMRSLGPEESKRR